MKTKPQPPLLILDMKHFTILCRQLYLQKLTQHLIGQKKRKSGNFISRLFSIARGGFEPSTLRV